MEGQTKENSNYGVTAYTYRDIYQWTSSATASVEYDRVIGIEMNNGVHTESFGDTSLKYNQQIFEMSAVMISGLRIAMNRIANKDHINCNLFSRLLHPDYRELARSDPDGRSWYPIEKFPVSSQQIKLLGIGAVGVIALENRGSVHSLVGLGEDSGLSIQVMSHGAELAIVPNVEILNFYQKLNPETKAGIYAIE